MTERQQQIARAVALGDSVGELARRLGMRPQSVRRHLSNLYAVTGARSQAELVGWCVAHGVVTVPELERIYCGDHKVGQGTEREPEGAALTGQIRR